MFRVVAVAALTGLAATVPATAADSRSKPDPKVKEISMNGIGVYVPKDWKQITRVAQDTGGNAYAIGPLQAEDTGFVMPRPEPGEEPPLPPRSGTIVHLTSTDRKQFASDDEAPASAVPLTVGGVKTRWELSNGEPGRTGQALSIRVYAPKKKVRVSLYAADPQTAFKIAASIHLPRARQRPNRRRRNALVEIFTLSRAGTPYTVRGRGRDWDGVDARAARRGRPAGAGSGWRRWASMLRWASSLVARRSRSASSSFRWIS